MEKTEGKEYAEVKKKGKSRQQESIDTFALGFKKKQMCENKTIKTTVEGKGKKREKKNSGHVRRKTRTFSTHMCLQCVSHRVILDGVFCFVFLCWPTIARRERREKKSKRKQVFLYRT